MTYRNIVIINDKEVDIKELTEEERKCLAEFWSLNWDVAMCKLQPR